MENLHLSEMYLGIGTYTYERWAEAWLKGAKQKSVSKNLFLSKYIDMWQLDRSADPT